MTLRQRSYLDEAREPAPGTVNLKNPVYTKQEKVRGVSRTLSPLSVGPGLLDKAAKLLRDRLPSWTKEDHKAAASKLKQMYDKLQGQYERALDKAAKELWGRPFKISDYRISCIGSDNFSEKQKEKLRKLCRKRSNISDAMYCHEYIVKHMKFKKRT